MYEGYVDDNIRSKQLYTAKDIYVIVPGRMFRQIPHLISMR